MLPAQALPPRNSAAEFRSPAPLIIATPPGSQNCGISAKRRLKIRKPGSKRLRFQLTNPQEFNIPLKRAHHDVQTVKKRVISGFLSTISQFSTRFFTQLLKTRMQIQLFAHERPSGINPTAVRQSTFHCFRFPDRRIT
jgi:hypothetical protein